MISQNLAQECALVILILLYGTVLARLVPKKYHLLLNIGISALAIIVGLAFGMDWTNMGLSVTHILPGLFVAIIASVIITVATLLIAAIPFLRHYFLGENLSNASGKLVAFEATIRIPLGTALVEEVLFRGVLLGILLMHHSTLVSLVIAAIIFGLWHIFPTINSIEDNAAIAKAMQHKKGRQYGSVIGVIIITATAGLIFGWLRIIAGSILAPWLVHWSINASGVLGIAVAKKLENSKGKVDGKE